MNGQKYNGHSSKSWSRLFFLATRQFIAFEIGRAHV